MSMGEIKAITLDGMCLEEVTFHKCILNSNIMSLGCLTMCGALPQERKEVPHSHAVPLTYSFIPDSKSNGKSI